MKNWLKSYELKHTKASKHTDSNLCESGRLQKYFFLVAQIDERQKKSWQCTHSNQDRESNNRKYKNQEFNASQDTLVFTHFVNHLDISEHAKETSTKNTNKQRKSNQNKYEKCSYDQIQRKLQNKTCTVSQSTPFGNFMLTNMISIPGLRTNEAEFMTTNAFHMIATFLFFYYLAAACASLEVIRNLEILVLAGFTLQYFLFLIIIFAVQALFLCFLIVFFVNFNLFFHLFSQPTDISFLFGSVSTFFENQKVHTSFLTTINIEILPHPFLNMRMHTVKTKEVLTIAKNNHIIMHFFLLADFAYVK